jgi:hypothetical protein
LFSVVAWASNDRVLPPEIANNFHDLAPLLNWLPKVVGYAGKKYGEWKLGRHKELENRILDYLNTQVQSSGLDGMWADVILKPIIQDVPLVVAFPTQLTGFAKIKQDWKKLPYETRHRWRMMRQYVPENEFKKVLLQLVRENRIGFTRLSERYHRL